MPSRSSRYSAPPRNRTRSDQRGEAVQRVGDVHADARRAGDDMSERRRGLLGAASTPPRRGRRPRSPARVQPPARRQRGQVQGARRDVHVGDLLRRRPGTWRAAGRTAPGSPRDPWSAPAPRPPPRRPARTPRRAVAGRGPGAPSGPAERPRDGRPSSRSVYSGWPLELGVRVSSTPVARGSTRATPMKRRGPAEREACSAWGTPTLVPVIVPFVTAVAGGSGWGLEGSRIAAVRSSSPEATPGSRDCCRSEEPQRATGRAPVIRVARALGMDGARLPISVSRTATSSTPRPAAGTRRAGRPGPFPSRGPRSVSTSAARAATACWLSAGLKSISGAGRGRVRPPG